MFFFFFFFEFVKLLHCSICNSASAVYETRSRHSFSLYFVLSMNNNVMYIFISEEWNVVKCEPRKCIWTLFKNHPCCSHKRWSFVIGNLSSQNIRSCSLCYAIPTIHMHGYLRGPTNIIFRTLLSDIVNTFYSPALRA
jgi:hypothetical protein